MSGQSWTCPFCQRPTTITGSDYDVSASTLAIENKHGDKTLVLHWIVCPNDKCKEYALTAILYDSEFVGNRRINKKKIGQWGLIPPSEAIVLPAYVPDAIKNDYYEACKIKDLSPKASATLARRCIQGMIRDFWKIKKKRLVDEINALKGKVQPLTWKAIDTVRNIGNIGAHMERI